MCASPLVKQVLVGQIDFFRAPSDMSGIEADAAGNLDSANEGLFAELMSLLRSISVLMLRSSLSYVKFS